MRLRPAEAKDAAAMARLHRESFAAAWGEDEIADLLAGPGGFALMVEQESVASGFILGRAVAGEAEVLTLAVRPQSRGRGLGQALMQAALGLARAGGSGEMFLEVAADNPAAIALYEKLGFARIGLRPGYYAQGGERPVDALVYRLDLAAG